MSYTRAYLSSEDFARIGQLINKSIDIIAYESYKGGYNDCLSDVINYLKDIQHPSDLITAVLNEFKI